MKSVEMNFKGLLRTLGCSSIALASAASWGADITLAENSAAQSQPFQIEEIVITARKVAESQQNVPISVAAFSAGDIRQDVVLSVADLGEHATGLFVSYSSQGEAPTFAIRATKTDNGIDGGVAVYLDDVPLVSTYGILNSFYDMSSVEILKGPQGTLFGVNTTGGTISFRPNKPTDKFEAYADVGYGNYNRREFEGMVNLPVNQVLQVRVAGDIVRRDGFVTNLTPVPGIPGKLNDDRHESLRFSARLKPTENLMNDIVADWYHEDDAPRQAIPVAFTPLSTLSSKNLYGFNIVSLGGDPSGINWPLYNKNRMWGIADTLNWTANANMSIKNVLGYRNDRNDGSQNNGGAFISFVNGHTLYTNTEWVDDLTLRLNTDDNRLRYTGGAYVSYKNEFQGINFLNGQNYGLLGFFGPPGPIGIQDVGNYDRDFHSKAVYSQVDYDLTKELTVALGLRNNWDTGQYRAQNAFGIGLPFPSGPFTPSAVIACDPRTSSQLSSFSAATCQGWASGSWRAPSYNFVITDKFADKSMLWFKVSGGYLAGGFNNQVVAQFSQFLPEKTTAFETGVKSDWEVWGRPIRTNIDAFYGKSSNKQETRTGTYTTTGVSFIGVFNAASLTYYGTDVEVKFFPTDTLELSALWTRVKAAYDNFTLPAIPNSDSPELNVSNARPAQIPKDTISLGITNKWPMPSRAGQLSSTLTGYYRSSINFQDQANTAAFGPSFNVGPAYWTSSFNTNWSGVLSSHIDLNLWVKNLFNKQYLIYSSPQSALGYAAFNYGDPRTYGANIRYTF